MSGTDIFISYARTDRPAARIFAQCFAEEGFSVWWDASLHSGETFDEVIEQRLRDAKAVVVLWSPRSVSSRWVRAEATLADRRNKLAPAIIEPCDRPIIFELTHAAELSGWSGDRSDPRWESFVHDLHHLVDKVTEQEASDPAKAKPAAAPSPDAARVAAPRQPLRPGNDEIIVASRAAREPVPARPQSVAEIRPHAPQEEPAAEIHCLEMENAVGEEELFVIDSTSVKIGRTAPADIVLPDKSISREHCVVGLANDELLVTDLNSTNGTFVDGERIARATILPLGSVVRLGRLTLKHAVYSAAELASRASQSSRGAPGSQRIAASS